MAKDPAPIRIGHLSTVYHMAFLLRGSALMGRHELRAAWNLFASGPDIISAMQRGELNLGYFSLLPIGQRDRQ